MPDKYLYPIVIDNLFEGVVLLGKDAKITVWNKWMEQTSGITAEKAKGKKFCDLFPDVEFSRIGNSIEQAVKLGQSSFISHTINPLMLPLYHFKNGAEKSKIFHNIRVSSLPVQSEHPVVLIYITDETSNVLKEQLLRKKALEEKELNEKFKKEIAERQVIEEKLRLNTLILNYTREGVVITDKDAIIESVNPAFIHITGYAAADAVGQHVRLLKSGKHSEEFYRKLWAELNGSGHWKGEFINKKPDGSLIIVESDIAAIKNSEGKISHYVNIFHDVTQRKYYEEMLELRSRTDPLTGLYNRRAFDEALELQWRVCLRHGFFMTLMMIDVDYFKNYNDTYGHQAGDDCLIKISEVLKNNVRRADDIIARYGGEEFIIVLTQTGPESIQKVAELILNSVESLRINHSASAASRYVTISMGIGMVIPWSDYSVTRLMDTADHALYQAKKSGRNRMIMQQIKKTEK